MKIAIYCRVSTFDQSPEMQLRDLREYCSARGFQVFKEYIDHGVSGSKVSRPQLNELMDDASKRKFKAVLVWKFDRFARSTKHLVNALEGFKELGIQFISYSENIDTTSAMGQMIFTVLSAIAQLERDIIRERVRGGLRNAKAKGKRLGRPETLKHRDQDRMVTLRKQDKSIRDIAETLGVPKSVVQRALAKAFPKEESA